MCFSILVFYFVDCEMNIHKSCVKVVEEHCIGALRHKKDKPKERSKRDRKSYIMENIIGKTRKPSHPVPAASKFQYILFVIFLLCLCHLKYS